MTFEELEESYYKLNKLVAILDKQIGKVNESRRVNESALQQDIDKIDDTADDLKRRVRFLEELMMANKQVVMQRS